MRSNGAMCTFGMLRIMCVGAIAFGLLSSLLRQAVAQCQLTKLIAEDPAANDRFGRAVAIDGQWCAVTAPNNQEFGALKGAIYLYQRAGMSLNFLTKLIPDDTADEDRVGSALAIEGDVMVVGVPMHDAQGANSGAAYVFRYNQEESAWQQEAKLLASDAWPDANFGNDVDISGDVIVVGAAKFSGATQSAAYVFRYQPERSTWIQEAILTEPSPNSYNQFGYGVAVSRDVVAVSASWDELNKGAVYVYRFDKTTTTWKQETKLTSPIAQEYTYFGSAIDLDGDVIVAGGAAVPESIGCGEVHPYAFRFDPSSSQWNQELFGVSAALTCLIWTNAQWVKVEGDMALFGDYTYPNDEGYPGAIRIFQHDALSNVWLEQATLLPEDGGSFSNHFPLSVAMDDGLAIGSASTDDEAGNDAEAVYVYDLSEEPCPPACLGDVNGNANVNVDDLLLVINGWGDCPPPPQACPPDIVPEGGDAMVRVDDLLAVINGWGPCE